MTTHDLREGLIGRSMGHLYLSANTGMTVLGMALHSRTGSQPGLVAGRKVRRFSLRLKRVGDWLKSTYQSEKFYEVLKTACGETAVLLFVFPLIDLLGAEAALRHRWSLPIGSVMVGFVFIGLAGIFANKEQEEKRKEDK